MSAAWSRRNPSNGFSTAWLTCRPVTGCGCVIVATRFRFYRMLRDMGYRWQTSHVAVDHFRGRDLARRTCHHRRVPS